MKTMFLCLFSLLAFGTIAQANRSVFLEIANLAGVANGSADVTTYDKTLTRTAVLAQGKAELAAAYWEGCGPWKVITSRREVIQEIEKIERVDGEAGVYQKLHELYDRDEIFAVVAAISSRRVECTLSWMNVYGTDGSKLELRYNMGD